jgi:cytochrome c oxidase cbb3-type subunit 3
MRRLRVRSPSAPLSSSQPDELPPLDTERDPDQPRAVNPAVSGWIFGALLVMVLGGLAAFNTLRPSATPPPAEIASDPVLVRGREVYLDRCASCHGPLGRGDGPTAKGLPGPPVGNLTDAKWKHGDRPEQVVGVIRGGVKGAQMPAWNGLISDDSIKSVAAYVYHLSGREVPGELRSK